MATDERDDEGAILVCGIFFCVLGVSAVYYLWSIAEVIRYRERVQDAADMAAFSGAVVHAHGMNLIALFNMVMAALLAILVALRLITLLCWFAIAAISAIAWLSGGALLAAVPPLRAVGKATQETAKRIQPTIHGIIKTVHGVGEAVARITPAASAARAIQLSRSGFEPDVRGASPIPLQWKLPVESDEFDVLCEHAGKYVGDMIMIPFEAIRVPEPIADKVSGAMARLTKAGSGWFCGKGGSPPSLTSDGKRRVSLPQSSASQRCMDPERTDVPTDGTLDEVCAEATLYELRSLPDRQGQCREGRAACPERCSEGSSDCPPTGSECARDLDDAELLRRARQPVPDCAALQWRLEAARQACAPKSDGGPDGLRGVWWVQQEVRRTYRSTGMEFVLAGEEEVGDPSVVMRDRDDTRHPCGRGGTVGEGYSRGGNACEAEAQCETPASSRPCPREPVPLAGQTFTERLTVVRDLVHCVHEQAVPREERERQAEELDVRPKGNAERLAPFKLEEGLWLGDDEFQLRSLAWGGGPNELPFRGVELAAWGQETGGMLEGATELMEGFAFAQGEYFYAGEGAPVEMPSTPDLLWKMSWRARLRPLKLGSGGLCSSGGDGPVGRRWPEGLSSACDGATEAIEAREAGRRR